MNARGSELVVRALEDEGVLFTFGIPGTHNIELYDALDKSKTVEPILVTDEQCASFMADAVSRTTGTVGVVNIVPGAGVTHCLSGVAEAFMDNIPLVVLACGIRGDTGKAFQLHDVDQLAILKPIVKAVMRPETPADIYSTVRDAFEKAREGTPGPVAVEIPAEFYLLNHEVPEPSWRKKGCQVPAPEAMDVDKAVKMLEKAAMPAIYVGYGAAAAQPELVLLAERLNAPVVTTIQGKGVFPEDHPLWLWNGFGRSAPRFVREIMDSCDCLLAIGCRFGEVATASYGMSPPENLIHVDINDAVFNRNYQANLCVKSDAKIFLTRLLEVMGSGRGSNDELKKRISEGRLETAAKWRGQKSPEGSVSPYAFFSALQSKADANAVYTTDSGNGTFIAMEQLRITKPHRFLSPTDFSCMGYAVPAAVGAKLCHRGSDVIAIEGDGSLLMTGLELLTAAAHKAAPLVCVLRDRELGQIGIFMRNAMVKATCTDLTDYCLEDFAKAVRCRYFLIKSDDDAEPVLKEAFSAVRAGEPSMVEVCIDYSQDTYFTKGVIVTNFWRYPWKERVRLAARFAKRKLVG